MLVGDGTLGWRPFAPYDAILVAAASPDDPGAAGGAARAGRPAWSFRWAIAHAGAHAGARAWATSVQTSTVADVRFVPLLGEFGFLLP